MMIWLFDGQRGPWRLARWFLSHISPPAHWLWAHRPSLNTLFILFILFINWFAIALNLKDWWININIVSVSVLLFVEGWLRGNRFSRRDADAWRDLATQSAAVTDLWINLYYQLLERRATDGQERNRDEPLAYLEGRPVREEVHDQGEDPRRHPEGDGPPPP